MTSGQNQGEGGWQGGNALHRTAQVRAQPEAQQETGRLRPVWREGSSDGCHDVDVPLRGGPAEVWHVLSWHKAWLAAVRPMCARGAGGLSRLALEGTGTRGPTLLHLPIILYRDVVFI